MISHSKPIKSRGSLKQIFNRIKIIVAKMKLLSLKSPYAKIYQYQLPCVFSSYNAVVLFCKSFIIKTLFSRSKHRKTMTIDI